MVVFLMLHGVSLIYRLEGSLSNIRRLTAESKVTGFLSFDMPMTPTEFLLTLSPPSGQPRRAINGL